MNAVSSLVATLTPSFPITIYKLASQHSNFEFIAPPKFVAHNRELSSDAKLLYGFYISKGGKQGYVTGKTRAEIQAELGFSSLHRLDRAQAELVKQKLILSLQSGNGNAKTVLLMPHADMELTVEQIRTQQAALPAHLVHQLKRKTAKATAEPIPDRDHQGQADLPLVPKQTKTALPSVPKALKIMDKKEIKKEEGQALPPTPPAIVPIKVEKKKRRARSKHSLELCLRFAKIEQQRKHSIEDAQVFGESCYWTGRHDHEIDRWLKQQAQAEVGKYQGSNCVTNSSTTVPLTCSIDEQALAAYQQLEQRREDAFAALSLDEQQQRVQAKLDAMLLSEHRAKYLRMSKERLEEHVIEAVKSDLISGRPQPSQQIKSPPITVS